MPAIVQNMTWRYQGPFDFHALYAQMRAYFNTITPQQFLTEKKYKDKGDEFEFAWKILQFYDPYTMIEYEIDFKAIDMRPISLQREGKDVQYWDGKLRVYLNASTKENYDDMPSPAGGRKIFAKKEGILHKLYKAVTRRDREEGVEDMAALHCVEVLEIIKKHCEAETAL